MKIGQKLTEDLSRLMQKEKKLAAEAAAAETEKKRATELNQIYDGAPSGMRVVDKDFKIMSQNKALGKLTGIGKEEARGMKCYQQLRGPLCGTQNCTLKQILKGKAMVDVEMEKERADGKKFPCRVMATPFKSPEGDIIGIIEVFTDITELRRLMQKEKELAQIAAASAETARKRAEELEKAYKRIEKSNKELKEATVQLIQAEKLSALGELTAGVAHELNQPLNVIKIICQSILRDIQKERYEQESVEQDLPEIVEQINKMAEIIDHMRIFTRRTEGTHRELIDVNMMIEGAFKFLGQQLKYHNIEVIKELKPDLPKVIGDPIRLEQVFLNLITNAKNALESGGKENKRIEISTYKVDHQKIVAVEVVDNGGGISEDLREKIFHPFFTTKEAGKGTGLGLSVAGKIIEEHQGRIELESKAGQGAIFRVILPMTD